MTRWEDLPLPADLATSQAAFLRRVGPVYENSSWVAALAWPRIAPGRLQTWGALAKAMRQLVDVASPQAQLALLRAHPELGGKPEDGSALTDHSREEQRRAGLGDCSPSELEDLRARNALYRRRFGFPFILAVTGLSHADIMTEMTRRLTTQTSDEHEEALRQVHRIAALRLEQLAASPELAG